MAPPSRLRGASVTNTCRSPRHALVTRQSQSPCLAPHHFRLKETPYSAAEFLFVRRAVGAGPLRLHEVLRLHGGRDVHLAAHDLLGIGEVHGPERLSEGVRNPSGFGRRRAGEEGLAGDVVEEPALNPEPFVVVLYVGVADVIGLSMQTPLRR